MAKAIKGLQVLLSDENILAINKPAGIFSIPARYDTDALNLKSQLQLQYGEIFTVHRLDKDTSGVILFARNPEAHQRFSFLFEKQQIEKSYHAICYGNPTRTKGEIQYPIRELNNKRGKYHVHPAGKPAHTSFEIKESFRRYSLLELQLITGRTHQIRVHLKALGIPLAADSFYGHRTELLLSEIKGKKYRSGKNTVEKPLMNRSSLHAHSITFVHPFTNDKLRIEAPYQKDFNATLKQLRKWDGKN